MKMENRLILATLIAAFLAVAMMIHVESAQTFDTSVPCIAEADCKDPRLPADARCQSGFCICLDQNGLPKNCTIRDPGARTAENVSSTSGNLATLQACKNHQDCNLPNEICNTTRSQCGCTEGYVMASKIRRCLPVAQTLGSLCEEDQQCQKTMGNTSCIDKQCVCNVGFHFTGNNTCSKILGFGERCVNDQECSHTENAVCNRQSWQCGCSEASVVNTNGDKCLLFATAMFDACIERSQCTKKFMESDCIDKRCQCLKNHHYDRVLAKCVSSRGIGESCSNNFECYQDPGPEENAVQPLMCTGSTCACRDGFRRNGDKCVFIEITDSASSLVSGMLIVLPAIVLLYRS